MSSCEEFQRLIQQDPETLTDLERASRFLYLQRLSFRGNVNRTMRVETHRSARGLKLFQFEGVLKLIFHCLAGVSIEHLDWSYFIVRYDRLKILFYLSPL